MIYNHRHWFPKIKSKLPFNGLGVIHDMATLGNMIYLATSNGVYNIDTTTLQLYKYPGVSSATHVTFKGTILRVLVTSSTVYPAAWDGTTFVSNGTLAVPNTPAKYSLRGNSTYLYASFGSPAGAKIRSIYPSVREITIIGGTTYAVGLCIDGDSVYFIAGNNYSKMFRYDYNTNTTTPLAQASGNWDPNFALKMLKDNNRILYVKPQCVLEYNITNDSWISKGNTLMYSLCSFGSDFYVTGLQRLWKFGTPGNYTEIILNYIPSNTTVTAAIECNGVLYLGTDKGFVYTYNG